MNPTLPSPRSAALPTVFVSHGAPTFALDPGPVGEALRAFADALPRPRAIVGVSPHWSTAVPVVGTAARPGTIHDFAGFPAELHRIRYEPPGAPEVAAETARLLQAAGLAARSDAFRGLDHGAWVPLRIMYPDADVPVTQLSLQPHRSPAEQVALGRALAPLAASGVLVLASGGFTHNLYEFDPSREHAPAEPYVVEFGDWMRERLREGDLDALLAYRSRAPHARRAHPTDEHLLPLFVAIGAAADWTRQHRVASGTTYGMIAMDAFSFGSPA